MSRTLSRCEECGIRFPSIRALAEHYATRRHRRPILFGTADQMYRRLTGTPARTGDGRDLVYAMRRLRVQDLDGWPTDRERYDGSPVEAVATTPDPGRVDVLALACRLAAADRSIGNTMAGWQRLV